MNNTTRHLLLLAGLCALLFFVKLGSHSLWPPDEPRFAQVAREMVQTGDFMAPRINGRPYTEKPPLFFWAEAAFSVPFGDVTEWPARLPSAFAGLLTVLMTWLLARRMFGGRVALWSGLILLSTQIFWWQSRFAQIDMLLTACMTLCLLSFWNWHQGGRKAWLWAFYAAIAAGVLAKGPPALVFPLLLAGFFYRGNAAKRREMHLFAGLALVAVVVALWLVPARMAISVETSANAGSGIAENMYRQIVGRIFLGIAHANPPWFYLKNMPLDLLPWSLFLPWTIPWVWRHRKEGGGMRLLLCWTVPAFILFSAIIGKRSIYLLPLYPAIAMLIARSVLDLVDQPGHDRWRKGVLGIWGGLLALGGVAVAAMPWTRQAAYWQPGMAAVAGVLVLLGLHALWRAWRTSARGVPVFLVAHFAIVAMLAVIVVFPIVDMQKSAREFCAPLRSLADRDVPYDLYSVGFSREEYIYYAHHFHQPVLCEQIEVPEMAHLSALEQGRQQLKLQRAIQDAVENVPVAEFGAVTAGEIDALRNTLDKSIREDDDTRELGEAYEHAVERQLEQLYNATREAAPVFLFVQEADWRWILALQPQMRDLRLVRQEGVGRRDVLLFANDAGAALISPRGL